MISLSSSLTGEHVQLYKLEQELKPLGFMVGSNWDYDHGYFDFKIDDRVGYQFLRIPFVAVDGQLDSRGATVEIQEPFLLSHKYQRGLDDYAMIGNISASFNQFSEPVDKDASFPEEYIQTGQNLLKEVESKLLTN